jgi:hypothetical protein
MLMDFGCSTGEYMVVDDMLDGGLILCRSGDHNNNNMERMNGEVRDREKVMHGLKRKDTTVLTGHTKHFY